MLIHDELQKLRVAVVKERARSIRIYDDAYPDVGWGKTDELCLIEALEELKAGGIIPADWKMP